MTQYCGWCNGELVTLTNFVNGEWVEVLVLKDLVSDGETRFDDKRHKDHLRYCDVRDSTKYIAENKQ